MEDKYQTDALYNLEACANRLHSINENIGIIKYSIYLLIILFVISAIF